MTLFSSIAFMIFFVLAQIAAANPAGNNSGADAQIVERMTAQKIYSDDSGKPQLAKTDQLSSGKGSIVAFTKFYSDGSNNTVYDIQLDLIYSADGKSNVASFPDACEIEGGSPRLRSFFYANADSEPDLEIGLICGWKDHPGADCPQYDQVRFFKVAKKAGGKVELERVENDLVKLLYRTEKSQTAPNEACEGKPLFNNAADVKRLLKTKRR